MATTRSRTLRPVPDVETQLMHRVIHGYKRAYRIAGDGPALLLIHGIGDSSAIWADLVPHLAKDYTVIAPDLLGHGQSDKPRGDYSVAAYANGMRDLLAVLGIERATVVGHSLGGAVAMQMAYQFPQLVERLVLVSSSGITKDVHPVLRLISVPVANEWMGMLRLPGGHSIARVAWNLLDQLHEGTVAPGAVLTRTPDIMRVLGELNDHAAYFAFLKSLRAVVDWRGQVVTLLDRCYLNEAIPVQIVWGARDTIFPVTHAHLAHSAMPGSRIAVFKNAGHYPFRSDSLGFLRVLEEFLSTTVPAEFDAAHWRHTLMSGVGEGDIVGGPMTRMAVLDAMGSSERSAT
ncbi:alpha/beta hydrolase [Aldersonia sp. NBC_00410]|uniref:alpha/beta fold hydrolase n=1 Tax=Aldersonia sp. NBC_00410 TaxID=2975954 RepID=UPI00224DD7E4|nr:alpha/beta hydrolase [Aldersonia sp. NBC_00410]MCX5042591.1 alpha/beta hydrolase [Aldersonia sp. NBC_00410]